MVLIHFSQLIVFRFKVNKISHLLKLASESADLNSRIIKKNSDDVTENLRSVNISKIDFAIEIAHVKS